MAKKIGEEIQEEGLRRPFDSEDGLDRVVRHFTHERQVPFSAVGTQGQTNGVILSLGRFGVRPRFYDLGGRAARQAVDGREHLFTQQAWPVGEIDERS